MENKINIAVIGTTGVGKSTLINYLLPDLINKPEARPGEPVTVKGFHSYVGTIDGIIDDKQCSIPINCYDSWGLEVDKYKEWMRDFKKALDVRGVNRLPSEWFHSIFYLIDASGSRVQENDLNIINLVRENNCRINVIFSKSDLVSEEESDLLHGVLRKHFGDTIPIADICSQEKKTRSGYHESFGREKIVQFMIDDLLLTMINRVPERFKFVMKNELRNFRNQVKVLINEKISWLTASEDADDVRKLFEKEIIPNLRDVFVQKIKQLNVEMNVYLEYMKVLISNITLEDSLTLGDYDKEYKTLYNGIFGDDPIVCLEFSDYIWTLGKFISKLNPLVATIDYANNFFNRGDRQRERILKSWDSIEYEAEKMVDSIVDEIKLNLEAAIRGSEHGS